MNLWQHSVCTLVNANTDITLANSWCSWCGLCLLSSSSNPWTTLNCSCSMAWGSSRVALSEGKSRSLNKENRNYWLYFIVYIIAYHGIFHCRGKGRPREFMLDGLWWWHGGISSKELFQNTHGQDLWRDKNVYSIWQGMWWYFMVVQWPIHFPGPVVARALLHHRSRFDKLIWAARLTSLNLVPGSGSG